MDKEIEDFMKKDCERVERNFIKKQLRELECVVALFKSIEDGVEIKVIDKPKRL